MTDERKRPSGGRPPASGRRDERKQHGQRPAGAAKGGPSAAGKPDRPGGGSKPYKPRDKGAAEAREPSRGPRPGGAAKGAGQGGARKFGGSGGGGKPYRPRDEASSEGREPSRGPRPGGAAKGAGQDGPRKFGGPGGGGKPFRPRDEASPEGREPSRGPRPGGAPRGTGQDGPRKFGGPGGGGKPYRPRDEASSEGRGPRPPRGGDAPPRRDGAKEFRPGRKERETAAVDAAAGEDERIARRLARAGVASRRDAEAMVAAGRVSVNGKVLDSPAVNVGPRDRITVDGEPIPEIERTRLFLFHKPAGLVTTSRDPEGRRTVFDVLPKDLPRVVTVGRLDINTEGLLLLTNDGGLARVLELPATGWLRRYRVRVHGEVDEARLAGLSDGIAVDGVFYGAIEASLDRVQGSNAWLTLGLREGKNREVKNVLGALGLEVSRLIRVSYGPFQLGDLAEGDIRELKGRHLRDQLGDRLIEESGANFDAPLRETRPGQSKPEAPKQDAPKRAGSAPGRPGKQDRRDAALGRLSTTRPAKAGKPRGRTAERDERDAAPARSRTANVWMAPGARPLGEKGLAEREARGEGRRYAGKPRPQQSRPSSTGADGPGRPGRKPPRGKGGPSGRGGK